MKSISLKSLYRCSDCKNIEPEINKAADTLERRSGDIAKVLDKKKCRDVEVTKASRGGGGHNTPETLFH